MFMLWLGNLYVVCLVDMELQCLNLSRKFFKVPSSNLHGGLHKKGLGLSRSAAPK